MKRAAVLIAAALVALSLSSATAAPQENWARGKVTAVSADSVTLDVKGKAMTFTVNTTTEVIARGAGTMAREKQKTGTKPTLTDVVKVGDNIEISYAESGGTMTAKVIRGGVSAPATTSAETPKRLDGEVTALAGTSLTIKPATGDPVEFMFDEKVRVTGVGLSTMTRQKEAAGAKVTLSDAVAVGDNVQVTYTVMGDMKHATAVRILKKK